MNYHAINASAPRPPGSWRCWRRRSRSWSWTRAKAGNVAHTGVCWKSTPPEKKPIWKIGFRITNSGAGMQFQPLDCLAKAGSVARTRVVFCYRASSRELVLIWRSDYMHQGPPPGTQGRQPGMRLEASSRFVGSKKPIAGLKSPVCASTSMGTVSPNSGFQTVLFRQYSTILSS